MREWITWRRVDFNYDQLHRFLGVAIARSGLCVTLQDSDFNYLFVANLFDYWHIEDGLEPDDAQIFGPDFAPRLLDIKKLVLDSGRPGRCEMFTESHFAFEFKIEKIVGPDEKSFILTRITDIAHKRVADKMTRNLLREVTHRSNNLLAIIQSIAEQTARNSSSIDGFVREFRGRLHSISSAQDLVTESSWKGARFQELVSHQIERYVSGGTRAIRFLGGDVSLTPNVALHIGLALNELIVDALSHGVFDSNAGSVTIELMRNEQGENEELKFSWREIFAIERSKEAQSVPANFSRVLLERIVPAAVSGYARYSAEPDAIVYELSFPVRSEKYKI